MVIKFVRHVSEQPDKDLTKFGRICLLLSDSNISFLDSITLVYPNLYCSNFATDALKAATNSTNHNTGRTTVNQSETPALLPAK